MSATQIFQGLVQGFTHMRKVAINRENRKIVFQSILAFLFIALAVYFIRHERTEISEVKNTLTSASPGLVLLGILFSGVFILLQGMMYVASFRSVGERVPLVQAMVLFIKRNFISIFLPAGGVSSLAFFTGNLEKRHISKSKIHMASTLYAVFSLVSVVVVAIPIFGYAILRSTVPMSDIGVLLALVGLLALLYGLARSLWLKGRAYRILLRFYPGFEAYLSELKSIEFRIRPIVITLVISVLIEFIGIIHLIISMHALNYPVTIEGAAMGYVVSVLFLIISPFIRGMGAIELSLAFVLTRYGFSNVEAISITFLYRFFEFWILVLVGAGSFLFVKNNIFLRILPVGLTFLLGLVNIFSVITPALQNRLKLLHDFLPFYAIDFSNYAILMIGIFLLVLSAFLLKGVRAAWYLALVMAIFSIIGNITKAIDYEEASLALVTTVALFLTRKQYFVRNNPKLFIVGINAALVSMLAVVVYGIIGFYFLDTRHFHVDFSLWESVKYTLQNFVFYQNPELEIHSRFAHNFLLSIQVSGGITMGFLLYTLIKPYLFEQKTEDEERQLALDLLKKYGKSQLDYFKVYHDKLLFFTEDRNAFLAYRISGHYAMVLENPVCASNEEMLKAISEFDRFCATNGMKSCFYRVPESSLVVYKQANKKLLFIGEEAVLDLTTWSTQGKDKKSIRTSSNKQKDAGLVAKVYEPPIKEGILQKIQLVSTEWQKERNYSELLFSQGSFNLAELRNQTLMVVENAEEKILAFANVIPDYAPGEATFDLIRNAKDSPNGIIEFLMAELFFYFQAKGYQSANLGFVALSGVETGENFSEKSIKFAYEKIRAFAHYKGLREFKEKFGPRWEKKYLVYSNDYDLFQIPQALKHVFKP